MAFPPPLKPGQRIAFAATARKITLEELQPAIDLVKSWELEPVIPDGLFAADNQLAGPDEVRSAVFQQLLDDDTVHAIWCVRGGYGTVRIVDRINWSCFTQKPKWIIGYSDITVFHSHLIPQGIITLHATMPINLPGNTPDTLDALRTVLFGEPLQYMLPEHPLNRPGNAKGKLAGGNLSVLYSLLGSVSDIHTEGCILFLEDLDEYLYHIDRMMQALLRSGKLDKLAALVVGGMSDMRDNTIPFGKSAETIISETVKPFGYPVYFGFPAGHQPRNVPLPIGQTAIISHNSLLWEFPANR